MTLFTWFIETSHIAWIAIIPNYGYQLFITEICCVTARMAANFGHRTSTWSVLIIPTPSHRHWRQDIVKVQASAGNIWKGGEGERRYIFFSRIINDDIYRVRVREVIFFLNLEFWSFRFQNQKIFRCQLPESDDEETKRVHINVLTGIVELLHHFP